MKRILLFLVLFLSVLGLQAQYVDFELTMWKGDFAVGDINGDGYYDIIMSGEEDGPWHEVGAIMLNDGSGNFILQEGERIITMGRSGNIHFGDINGDGHLDIIFGGWGVEGSSRGIALNNGNGVFTLADPAKYPLIEADRVTSCGFADFNLDGLLDYYFFTDHRWQDTERNIIFFQQPDGSFVADNSSFGSFKWIEPEVTVIDFNKDGYPDIFITCHNDELTPAQKWSGLFKNDGFGVFTYFAGADLGALDPNYYQGNGTTTWGDIDGDGYPDLLINGDQPNGADGDGNFRIFKNVGGTSFQLKGEWSKLRQGGVGNGSLLVDWNNDGILDFIIGGWDFDAGRQATRLYLGTDAANFTFEQADNEYFLPGVSEAGYRVADLNGDNKVELLFCGFGSIDRRVAGYFPNNSTAASVPPAAPTNLDLQIRDSETMFVFTWTPPTSEAGKFGTSYNLALKNTTTGKWFYNPMAVIGGEKNGWRKVAGRMGNVFYNTRYELYDLPEGNYEWTVQAINGAFIGGAFAAVNTFKVGNPPENINRIGIYEPNVFTNGDVLKVNGEDGVQTLNVYSVSGVLIASKTFTGNTEVKLSKGAYIVEIVKRSCTPYRTKVLVR